MTRKVVSILSAVAMIFVAAPATAGAHRFGLSDSDYHARQIAEADCGRADDWVCSQFPRSKRVSAVGNHSYWITYAYKEHHLWRGWPFNVSRTCDTRVKFSHGIYKWQRKRCGPEVGGP